MTSSRATAGLHAPRRYPYMIGVYLATNAIPDAATVVDGPDCTFFKAEFIHGRHDLNSTLLDVLGAHRILTTMTNTDNIATNTGQAVLDRVLSASRLDELSLILVTSMPMVTVIGLQYDQLIRDHGSEIAKDVVLVPGRSLQGDWLLGYAETLTALAREIQRPAEEPTPDSVSIIGYFMDRNEEDHRGNVAELRRLVERLDLRLDTIWLSGSPWTELRRVARSGVLLALPMGRAAAAIIGEQTGARVVPVETPFGLAPSADFLRTLGRVTDREELAEDVIREEVGRATSKLEWAVPHFFLGRRVAISATPDLLPGFVEIVTELGMEVIELASPATRPAWYAPSVEHAVSFDTLFSKSEWGSDRPDLIIGDSLLIEAVHEACPALELGFPSHTDHALFDRPYLGFRGHSALIQRILTALAIGGRRPGQPRSG